MNKRKNKIIFWNNIFVIMSIIDRMIEYLDCRWQNILTIIMFIALSKNIWRKLCIMTTKVSQNKRSFDERKKFDVTKFFLTNSLICTRISMLTKLKKISKNVICFQFYEIKNRVLLNFKNITFNRFSKK